MMKTPLTVITLICSCALVSFADESKKNQEVEVFKAFDSNSDGSVSFEEYRAGMASQMSPERVPGVFKQKDRNGDGKLSMAELFYAPQDPAKTDQKGDKKKDDKKAKTK